MVSVRSITVGGAIAMAVGSTGLQRSFVGLRAHFVCVNVVVGREVKVCGMRVGRGGLSGFCSSNKDSAAGMRRSKW